MTRKEINIALCVILTTLAEVEYAPESSFYLFFNMDIEKYTLVRGILLKAELVKRSNDTLALTAKGREMAQEINSHNAVEMDKKPNGKTLATTPAG